jgi:hypothetical protein
MVDIGYRSISLENNTNNVSTFFNELHPDGVSWSEDQISEYNIDDLTETFIQDTEETSIIINHFKEWTANQLDISIFIIHFKSL